MEWNIFGVMDAILEKATARGWANLSNIQEEYRTFCDSEKKDREEATVEGVDLSSASSLFGGRSAAA